MIRLRRYVAPVYQFPCICGIVFFYCILELNLFDNWQVFTNFFQLFSFDSGGISSVLPVLKSVYTSSQAFCNSRFYFGESFYVLLGDFLQNPYNTCKTSGYDSYYKCFQFLLLLNSSWLGCIIGDSIIHMKRFRTYFNLGDE